MYPSHTVCGSRVLGYHPWRSCMQSWTTRTSNLKPLTTLLSPELRLLQWHCSGKASTKSLETSRSAGCRGIHSSVRHSILCPACCTALSLLTHSVTLRYRAPSHCLLPPPTVLRSASCLLDCAKPGDFTLHIALHSTLAVSLRYTLCYAAPCNVLTLVCYE